MALAKLSIPSIEKIDYVITSRMNIDQVFAKYKPDYLINGCMYDMGGGATITNSVDENKRYGVYFSKRGIGIVDHIRPIGTTIDEAIKNDSIRDFIGGAPLLVWNGKVDIDRTGLKDYYMNATRLRSVLGCDGNNIYLYVPDKAKSFRTLASECASLGMQFAINLDGGGSTIMGKNSNGKLVYLGPHTEKRTNANWILVYLKKHSKQEKQVNTMSVKTSTYTEVKVEVTENGKTSSYNGMVIDGVTYAPVRKIYEGQGAKVDYDAKNKVVHITR